MFVNECLVGLFYDLIFGGFFMGAIVGFLYTSIYFGLIVNFFLTLELVGVLYWVGFDQGSHNTWLSKLQRFASRQPGCIEPACSSFVYSERWLRRFTAECRMIQKLNIIYFFCFYFNLTWIKDNEIIHLYVLCQILNCIISEFTYILLYISAF